MTSGPSKGCAHRLAGEDASYCFLQSRGAVGPGGAMALVFEGERPGWPARCDSALLSVCPFREAPRADRGRGPLVPCPFCGRRHRSGSTSKRLCEDWHSVKAALRGMRGRRPAGKGYFEEGTTLLPYPPDTPDLVRQLIWPRLKVAVMRRDRHTCQDCGEGFGRARRWVYDRALRKGRGGYRRESLEVHHIVPRSRGGSDHPGNLKTLCPRCHRGHTGELRADAAEARRREGEVARQMRECQDEEGAWDPPAD